MDRIVDIGFIELRLQFTHDGTACKRQRVTTNH